MTLFRISILVDKRRRDRRGSVLVLAAVLMVVLMSFLAFAVDVGYLANVRTELQRSADAAAMAAAWELIDPEAPTGAPLSSQVISDTRNRAVEYAALNLVSWNTPTVDLNSANLVDGDLVIGYLANFADLNAAMDYSDPTNYNALRVRVRKSASQNGEAPLFFANVLGMNSSEVQAEAYAGAMRNIAGFRPPADGSPLPVMPFAFDEETWEDILASNATDDWTWNDDDQTVTAGPDGIVEGNLYPQATGSPGNRGTIDIGSANNSTADLSRQITDGVSEADLDYHGGSLTLDEYGELSLNGDPGISNGIKDELASVIGEPKVVAIFRQLTGNGNNAQYTIVKWVGIRLLEVHMIGSDKRVIFQPANVIMDGAIAADGNESASDYVYARPELIR